MLRYMLIVSVVSIPMSVYTMDLSDLSSSPVVRRVHRASINAEYAGNSDELSNEAVMLQKRKEFMARIKEFMPAAKLAKSKELSVKMLLIAFVLFTTGQGAFEHAGTTIGHLLVGNTNQACGYAILTLLCAIAIAWLFEELRKPDVNYTQEVEKFKNVAQEYGISAQLAEGFLTCPAFIECYEHQLQTDENLQQLLEQLNNQKKLCAAQYGNQ